MSDTEESTGEPAVQTYLVAIKIEVTDHVLVHAGSTDEAWNTARLCARERLKYHFSDTASSGDKSTLTILNSTVEDRGRRADTYVCTSCGKPAPKSMFGPGWIKCPSCGAEQAKKGETTS